MRLKTMLTGCLALCMSVTFAQTKAAEGTFQLVLPTEKLLHSKSEWLNEELLQEIESQRLNEQSKDLELANGARVIILSKREVEQGIRLPQFQLNLSTNTKTEEHEQD